MESPGRRCRERLRHRMAALGYRLRRGVGYEMGLQGWHLLEEVLP